MKTSPALLYFYRDLGRRTFKAFDLVRGEKDKKAALKKDWDNFSKDEGFLKFSRERNMVPEEIEEFRKGFESHKELTTATKS